MLTEWALCAKPFVDVIAPVLTLLVAVGVGWVGYQQWLIAQAQRSLSEEKIRLYC